MAIDFESKGVQFYFVYKSLAHPGWNNYSPPRDLNERLQHVAEAKRTLGTSIPWLCDRMDNQFSRALGGSPNSDVIVDDGARVVARHGWNRPEQLRTVLEGLVGPTEKRTDPASLKLPAFKPKNVASGKVPQVQPPTESMSIRVTPENDGSGDPQYVKLRAEVDLDMVVNWEGELFLRFDLDPVWQAHWNNLQQPIQLQFEADESVEFEPSEPMGPKVEAESDSDPRTFKVRVRNWNPDQPIKVVANYLICNDEEGWCKPVSRKFELRCLEAVEPGMRLAESKIGRVYEYLRYRDEGPPVPKINASAEQIASIVGEWQLTTSNDFGQEMRWILHVSSSKEGLNAWTTLDPSKPSVDIIVFDGASLQFLQRNGPVPELIKLKLADDQAKGTHESIFGDDKISGKRTSKPPTLAKVPSEKDSLAGKSNSLQDASAKPSSPSNAAGKMNRKAEAKNEKKKKTKNKRNSKGKDKSKIKKKIKVKKIIVRKPKESDE